jgi:hypothetical protein
VRLFNKVILRTKTCDRINPIFRGVLVVSAKRDRQPNVKMCPLAGISGGNGGELSVGIVFKDQKRHGRFTGPLIPIASCPGIFAIDGSSDVASIVANMGALLRELGPHVHWSWWSKTKIKFGPIECHLRRDENGVVIARRLKIDRNSGRVWYCPMDKSVKA